MNEEFLTSKFGQEEFEEQQRLAEERLEQSSKQENKTIPINKQMKIYKLTQDVKRGYDTYDSIIVCAENEDEARKIPPNSHYKLNDGKFMFRTLEIDSWAVNPLDVVVEYLGEAKPGLKKGIILASYKSG